MDDVKKMFRTLVNGQSALKEELLNRLEGLRKDIVKNRDEIKRVEINMTKRIDKLGLQLANLEDDAPTNVEFDKLEKKVTNLEQKFTSV